MKQKIILSMIACAVFSVGMQAQYVARSLEECIQYALENNLTLQSGKISIQRAKDLQGTAFNPERTNFSISQDPTSGGSPDNSLSVSQSFDFPSVYFARHNRLKAETELEKSRREISKNELIRDISGIYYKLLFLKENITILEEQDSLYQKFFFLASAKFKAGETNRLEQINAEKLRGENKIELQKVKKDYQNACLALQKWINSDEEIEPKEPFLPILKLANPVDNWNITQTPFHQLYENQVIVSEKNVSLHRQEFLPGINFSLRNQFIWESFNPYHIQRERFKKGDFIYFEAGINIPLFFGEQRAKTKAAQRETEILRLQKIDAMQSLQKEYQTYRNEYQKMKINLDYYADIAVKQADEIRRLSQLLYEKGEIGYVEYIQNLKSAVEIRLQYVATINEYNQIVILLNFLQGYNDNIITN